MEKVLSLLTSLSPRAYRARLNQQMHKENRFCGQEWRRQLPVVRRLIPNLDNLSVLDFGCGPTGGLSNVLEHCYPYDPFVEQFCQLPPKNFHFDVAFTCDVLEHLTQREIFSFFSLLRQYKPTYVFINVSTRKAVLRLPNGSNAHLSIRSRQWWQGQFAKAFVCQYDLLLNLFNPIRSELTIGYTNELKNASPVTIAMASSD